MTSSFWIENDSSLISKNSLLHYYKGFACLICSYMSIYYSMFDSSVSICHYEIEKVLSIKWTRENKSKLTKRLYPEWFEWNIHHCASLEWYVSIKWHEYEHLFMYSMFVWTKKGPFKLILSKNRLFYNAHELQNSLSKTKTWAMHCLYKREAAIKS